ncbi:28S ribosomal protein S22, mitochondrial-like [Stegodyphus dumicola]|uniref:28S ribosomal protein S22, mitochondrial-like n=1 Tax=Stegodyphus dumicola TaxID=202533 RepID=UPI0015AB30F2|nr:28S ribosomal protein S22, mitochondrial-like [Stegodyphus dumicola]
MFRLDNNYHEIFQLQNIAAYRAKLKLQMPPMIEVREPVDEVLSKDPELQGFLNCKLVFTDISPGISAKDRMITVRETDGTLRKASWEERSYMNQIFFPEPGRSLETPKLFESPYLERLLDEESYIFVLDSACIQFEPDDPEYHRVTHETYDHIRLKKKFDILRSTRHFGPMAFYFAYEKNIDALLVDMIERQLISDAFDTIRLLYILHPELKLFENIDEVNELEFIQDYINRNTSSEKANLELAFQTYLEKQTSAEKEESVN